MKKILLQALVDMIFKVMTSDQLKLWVVEGLDLLAQKIKETDNTVDDTIVIPLIEVIKEAFSLDE
jgi:hypothetical protein